MPDTPQLRICAGCGKKVVPGKYRKNRYGEYVCGDCMRKGFRFSTRRTVLRLARHAMKFGRRVAVRVFIAALLLAVLYVVLERLTNPPTPSVQAPSP